MPPAYEVLLLNTAVPQIQAAQSGDTYVVPRDIAVNAQLTVTGNVGIGTTSVPSVGSTTVLAVGNASGGTHAIVQSGSIVYRTSASTSSVDFYCPNNVPLTWYQSGTDAMTLTSTGLGIGTSSPAYKLDVSGTINSGASNATGYNLVFRTSGITTGRAQTSLTNTSGDLYTGIEGSTAGQTLTGSAAYSAFIGTFTANPLYLVTNGLIRTTLDSSGNLGLGVTPSAWAAGWNAQQIGYSYGLMASSSVNAWYQLNNSYFDGSFKYKNNGFACSYEQGSGTHIWKTAPSGTAGNAISFSQALTLDANRNLALNTTSVGTSAVGVLSVGSGTEPSSGPADTVQIYSVDRSAGNTIPAIYCEGSGVTNAGITNVTVTHKIAIKVNGTVYYLLATTDAT